MISSASSLRLESKNLKESAGGLPGACRFRYLSYQLSQHDLSGTDCYAFSLDYMNVAVWNDPGEFVDTLTWRRPMDLEFVELSCGADPENFSEIMRG